MVYVTITFTILITLYAAAAKNHTASAQSSILKTQKPDLSGHTAPTVRFNNKKRKKNVFCEIFSEISLSERGSRNKKPHHDCPLSADGKKPHRRLAYPVREISLFQLTEFPLINHFAVADRKLNQKCFLLHLLHSQSEFRNDFFRLRFLLFTPPAGI